MCSPRGVVFDMLVNPVAEYWHNLQAQRPEWALRAYARLLKTLSKDVQERLQSKEEGAEPYVAVFGKTQVGKTTLLLDLMGIAPAHMAGISLVLRGGREAGRSATATTMEYRRSENSNWGLCVQGKTQYLKGDDEMTRALGAIREKMESGRLVADSPCVVHIPQGYFSGGKAALGVRMLDLPGDNPTNEQEQRHVHLMAKTYLPFADLILLVGKGDDLGFLKPGVITLPGIEDWQSMPYRFRIVTTYSYSSQSVKDILRKEQGVDATRVRQRLIEQIERFGDLSETARQESLFFPLEFGNSWGHAKKSEPELYSRMEPIIAELRAELLSQISSSTTPMGRLRSTLNTHVSVLYIQKKKNEAITTEITALGRKKEGVANDLKTWERLVKDAQRIVNALSELLAANPKALGKEAIDNAGKTLLAAPPRRYIPEEGSVKDDCETLKALMRNYCRALGGMHLEVSAGKCPPAYWRHVHNSLEELKSSVIEDVLDDAFWSIRSKLNDYFIDTYLSSSNYQADRDSVRSAGRTALVALTELWQGKWLSALSRADTAVRRELEQARATLNVHQDEERKTRGEHHLIKQQIATLEVERKRVALSSKEDLERCEHFIDLLKQEYAAELDERYTAAMHVPDDSDALLHLLSCVALGYQYQEFIALNEQSAS